MNCLFHSHIKTTEITLNVDFGRTLRDEYLSYESKQLHNEYLAKGTISVAEVTKQLNPLEETVEQLEDVLNTKIIYIKYTYIFIDLTNV